MNRLLRLQTQSVTEIVFSQRIDSTYTDILNGFEHVHMGRIDTCVFTNLVLFNFWVEVKNKPSDLSTQYGYLYTGSKMENERQFHRIRSRVELRSADILYLSLQSRSGIDFRDDALDAKFADCPLWPTLKVSKRLHHYSQVIQNVNIEFEE